MTRTSGRADANSFFASRRRKRGRASGKRESEKLPGTADPDPQPAGRAKGRTGRAEPASKSRPEAQREPPPLSGSSDGNPLGRSGEYRGGAGKEAKSFYNRQALFCHSQSPGRADDPGPASVGLAEKGKGCVGRRFSIRPFVFPYRPKEGRAL